LARELRRIPLFSFASTDELFRFSEISRQVRHAEGSVFQKKGAPAEYIQVLIEGRARVSNAGGETEESGPPRLFGFREVLEGATLSETAEALEASICVAMGAEDFRTLMSDDIELAEGVFQMLLDTPTESAPPSVLRGMFRSQYDEEGQGLKPLAKALILRSLPIFSKLSAEEIMDLTAIVREVPLEADRAVISEGDPPAFWMVLSGEFALEPPQGGEPLVLAAGDILGVEETLAGRDFGWRGQARQNGRALKIDRGDLFELLAQRTDILQGVSGALFQSSRLVSKGDE
jgi:CRP-like cAMP-binding protein